ncbi:hypothetical protein [Micromonospora sp. NPDC005806]|uniref:hypothetical protein n=1 Tax=Micromonospora sp. NPDC005806 TaxID=3364234 RepID=UPI00367F33EB
MGEPYLKITDPVHGVSVRQSKRIDWNWYADELSFTQHVSVSGRGPNPTRVSTRTSG